MLDRRKPRLSVALRERGEDGFATIQAMAIIVVLLATMAALVGAAAANRSSAREGREFTDTRRGADAGQSQLLEEWNALTLAGGSPFGISGVSPKSGSLLAGTGYTTTYATTLSGRTVTITSTSTAAEGTQTVEGTTLPVRSRLVASSKNVAGGVAAGIPAGPTLPNTGAPTNTQDTLGAWGSAVTSAANTVTGGITYISHVRSGVYGNEAKTSPGQWDIYGGTVGYAGGAKVVSYADDVVPPTTPGQTGMPGTYERSQVNAYLDERQHNQLMANITTNAASCNGGAGQGTLLNTTNLTSSIATYFCAKGNVTLDNVVRNVTGVTTVVVKGDLTLTGSISTSSAGMPAGAGGEIHFYVDGQVYFADPSGVGVQSINRAYFFAPNKHCVNGSNNVVNVVGSIACLRVQLAAVGSTVSWLKPRNQPAALPYTFSNVEAPRPVYFFEKSGFNDYLTPNPAP